MRETRRAIIVVNRKESLNEFKSLVKEAGYEIVGTVYIRRFTSAGLSEYKINEVKELMKKTLADNIIFDIQLKPKYLYNIGKELGVEPKDRVEIILEIFRKHSPSKEAALQIKMASLQYELTRLREKVRLRHIGEQTAITSGLGEYEIDLYYRDIERQIQNIKEKLLAERKRRDLHRLYRYRRGFKTISITGYYSSGKTTLFNLLTNSNEAVGEEPFTTLSTKFSIIKIGPWKCYIVDTIGFISDLPPFMITSFYSTLEEIKFSDLVLLMIDVSEPYDVVMKKINTSFDILKDIGYNKDIIIIGNKIDLVNNLEALKSIESLFREYNGEDYVLISAEKNINISQLFEIVEFKLGVKMRIRIHVPYQNKWYKTLDYLKGLMGEYKVSFNSNEVIVSGEIDVGKYDIIKKFISKNGGKVYEEEGIDIEAFP